MSTDEILEIAVALLQEGDYSTGLCLACRAEADEVEPDAEGYPCHECGKRKVAGAEQIVLMYGGLV